MTTLPEELRKLAKANDAQVRADRDGASNSYYSGCREAFQRAADLAEADPLVKAAPELVRLTRSALRQLEAHGVGFVDPPTRLIELLATLPKEG
jgi:hypothetical protein